MRLRCVLVAVVVVVAGCGSSGPKLTGKPVTPAEWHAVVTDWQTHGRAVDKHSCGAVVTALTHGQSGMLAVDLVFYANEVCTHHPDVGRITRGMSDEDVAAVAGMPRNLGLRCWRYPERRVCFTSGRASIVQGVTHG